MARLKESSDGRWASIIISPIPPRCLVWRATRSDEIPFSALSSFFVLCHIHFNPLIPYFHPCIFPVSCESDVTRVESIYRAWWRSDRSSVGCWSRGSFISESTTRSSHTRRHWMLPIAYIACILFASGSLSQHWWNRGVGLYPFSLALFLKSIVYCQYYTSSIFPSLEVDYRAEKKRPPFSKIHGGHYQVYDVHTSITKHITRVI